LRSTRLCLSDFDTNQAMTATHKTRRNFIAGLGALIASAPFVSRSAQTGERAPRIDVHHHVSFPRFDQALKAEGVRTVPWTVEQSVAEMDKSGIALAVTSLIQPSVSFGDMALGRALSREANEFGARLVREHPGRFGAFGTIPYADTEGSLKEIEYALDTLRLEGFQLMTSYSGKYPGDPVFWPVLEELNRRSAVVYTHPLVPACCGSTVPGVSPGTIEYATDTTRTIASLLFSGAAARFSNIRWIFSHSGGTMPFLLSRFVQEERLMKDKSEKLPKGLMYELAKFYYDTAQGNHAGALSALVKIAPISQILYGTDYPFRGGAEENAGLAAYGFTAAELRAIDRENALKLMPRLAKS
jgi:6-methylsalicylate decarboxylase